MINAVSNYEKTKLSMANVFLQYDQDTMIAKFSGRVDTSVTECIPHRIPDVRHFRIRLFTKRIIQQLSVNTDIYFRPC